MYPLGFNDFWIILNPKNGSFVWCKTPEHHTKSNISSSKTSSKISAFTKVTLLILFSEAKLYPSLKAGSVGSKA